jgi:hypothetical protein
MKVVSSFEELGSVQTAWHYHPDHQTRPSFLLLSESLLMWNHILFVLFLSDELDNDHCDAVLPVEEK